MTDATPQRPMISVVSGIQEGDRMIGNGPNELLYHSSDDLKHFREITDGQVVIVGKTTYDSMTQEYKIPMNKRYITIVMSRDGMIADHGVATVDSAKDAVKIAQQKARENDKEIFVIGGGQIYKAMLPYTDRLYLTIFKGTKSGDRAFPEYENIFTKVVEQQEHTDKKNGQEMTFVVLEKE
jgi:dihydrofolate reductase